MGDNLFASPSTLRREVPHFKNEITRLLPGCSANKNINQNAMQYADVKTSILCDARLRYDC